MNWKIFVPVLFLFSCSVVQNNGPQNNPGNGTLPELTGVFVSATGSDANLGTNRSSPLLTLSTAVSNAAANGLTNLYISQGTYIPGAGLDGAIHGVLITNSGLHFSGGWNNDFSAISGYSVLDGTNGLTHVVSVMSVSNMFMEGLLVRNGLANGNSPWESNGAGMVLSNIFDCVISNVVVSNNSAMLHGGGVWMYGTSNLICGLITRNSSGNGFPNYGSGGGLFLSSGSRYNLFSGEVSYNSAYIGGGMLLNTNSGNNRFFGTNAHNTVSIFDNSAHKGGGGICLLSSASNLFQVHFNANVSDGWGGGISVNGNANVIGGTFSSNSAFGGAAIVHAAGNNNVIQADLLDNSAVNLGGGVDIESGSVTISGFILRNYAWYGGGGIYKYNGTAYLTNLIIVNNSVSDGHNGGGIYHQMGSLDTNGLTLYNNYPSDYFQQ